MNKVIKVDFFGENLNILLCYIFQQFLIMFWHLVTIDKGGTLFSTIELKYLLKLFMVVFSMVSIVEIAKFLIVIIRVWSWVDGKPN